MGLPVTHHAPSDGLIVGRYQYLKVFIISFIPPLTIVVFATTSEVLADRLNCRTRNIVGGYAGAKLVLSKGDKLIRHFLTGAIDRDGNQAHLLLEAGLHCIIGPSKLGR